MAVLSTTGMEPEEVSIREKIRPFATMLEYAPPEPNDTTTGLITFTFAPSDREKTRHVELSILASFGFVRAILAKVVVFKLVEQGEGGSYFVGAQVYYCSLVLMDQLTRPRLAVMNSGLMGKR
jgi:hypothetical protein